MSQSFLSSLPFWLWPLLLAAFASVIVLAVTRDKKKALATAGIGTMLVAVLIMIHYFDLYLNNHFVATFDETGLPTDFTRSGPYLLLDAWPIWLVPSLLIGLALSASFYWHHLQMRFFPKQRRSAIKKELGEYIEDQKVSKSLPETRDMVADKLEIEKLKHKLAVAEEKFRVVKEQQGGPLRSNKAADKYVEELRQARLELGKERKATEALKQQVQNQEEDLERANSLIDRLLNEKFSNEEGK